MSADAWPALAAAGIERCWVVRDAPSGLFAVVVIDDVTLGPAAGGVRTRAYPSVEAALADAAALARAMTIKCALAGLAAGGGKAVVLDHAGLDRARAFAVLGERIDELGGLFRTAGDLGTTPADLAVMASRCRWVHDDERGLADAVARGLVRCIAACVAVHARDSATLRTRSAVELAPADPPPPTVRHLHAAAGVANSSPPSLGHPDAVGGISGVRVAIQGCGSIGAAAARALAAAGASLVVADLDPARAAAVADETGASVVAPDELLSAEVDVVAPCAGGGVITAGVVERLRAWAICGAANNALAGDDVAAELGARGVLVVPDVIASAGAVIDGIGASVMGLRDRGPLIDALGVTARSVLEEAQETGRPSTTLAVERARARPAAAPTQASARW